MKLPALIALAWLPVAVAQTSTPPTSDSSSQTVPSFRSQSLLVLVPTLVKDHDGKLVFALSAKDFSVTDNGVEQNIVLEDDTDSQPLALVIAVETGGAGARQLDNYRNLGPLLEAMVGNVPHRVAVVGFDSDSRVLQEFTPEFEQVAQTMGALAPGDKGAAILDGIAFSVDLLRKQPPEYRRAILLLSETVDRGSHITLEEALRRIGESNTVICSLAFSTSKSDLKDGLPRAVSDSRPGPPTRCMGKDPDADPATSQNRLAQLWGCIGLLAPPLRAAQIAAMVGIEGLRRDTPQTVAQLTGGEFYKFNNPRSLQKTLATLANHVPNRYVLSFRPQSPQTGPHALQVRLKDYPNLEVTARKTYWVEDGAAHSPNR